jgi:PAS domain S-box-containing protein
MSQELEIILTRQFAEALALPIFVTDPEGNLLYYNRPAEEILGKRFEETGSMAASEWAVVFNPFDADGKPVPPQDLPLVKTLNDKEPHHSHFGIENLQGETVHLRVTSYPIIGRAQRFLGALAIFWKEEDL